MTEEEIMAFSEAFVGDIIATTGAGLEAHEQVFTMKIQNDDLFSPSVTHDRGSPVGLPGWTPFDVNLDGSQGKIVQLEIRIESGSRFRFLQKNGYAFTVSSHRDAALCQIISLDPKLLKVNIDNRPGVEFQFNLGVLIKGNGWLLPIFIDPKVHNNGGT